MFYSRKINQETQKVEVWECEWSNKGTGTAKKEYLRKVGDEDEIEFSHDDYGPEDAVCWAPGRTIGNIAVSTEDTFGMFEGTSGNDAILPCQLFLLGNSAMVQAGGTVKLTKSIGAQRQITQQQQNQAKYSAVIILQG